MAGDACDFDDMTPDEACAPGLYCAFGSCAPACGDGCGEGERCVDFTDRLDGLEFDFCYDSCDLYGQDCGEAQACVLFDEDQDDNALAGCLEFPSGENTQNQNCVPDMMTYWSDCTAGHLCAQLDADPNEPRVCLGFCDRADQSLCTDGSACVYNLLNGLDLGICLGECSVLGDDSGCGDGEICSFSFRIGQGAGGEQPVGFCNPGTAEVGTAEACTLNEDDGTHNCTNGHICAALQQGAPTECIKLCDTGDNACPAGFSCTTGVFGGDEQGNGASETVGFCAEMQDG